MRFIRKSVERLEGYVPGEQPKATDIIKLNTNENPYAPSIKVYEALQAFDPTMLRKYPNPVSADLCGIISSLHGVEREQVIVGNGSDELLALCTRAFVENDGTVGCFDPSYSLYPVLTDIRDVRISRVPLGEGFAWPDVIPSFDLFFITLPNAPTGRSYSLEVLRDFCGSYPGVVVLDEAYVDFAEEDVMSFASAFENVVVLRTLSKGYALAGIRLGYAVGSAGLIEALYKIKDSYNVNILTQCVAAVALEDQGYKDMICAKVCATRERVTGALRQRGWILDDSEANFLWAIPAGASAEVWFRHLREKNILVRYFPGDLTGCYLRITVGTDEEMDVFLDVPSPDVSSLV